MKSYPLYHHPVLKDFRQLLDWRAGETPDSIAFQYKDKSLLVSVTYVQFRTEVDTYTHTTGDMQKRAAEIVEEFMTDIFGKELRPWEENAETARVPSD